MKRIFVNIYQDEYGKYISDKEYDSYDSAYKNRDEVLGYIETVEIIREVDKENN